MLDLKIINGTAITPNGRERIDIGVKDEHIVEFGDLSNTNATKTIDASGKFVLPGIIDTQVHFREPGNEHKENLESGTKGAVLGGITGVFEMPNTNPPTTTPQALQDKLDRASKKAWCDYAFYVGGTPDKAADWHLLEELPGCCGIKIFMGSSTGNLLVDQDEAIANILSQTTRRAAIHSEDEARLKERFYLAEQGGHAKYHPIWRDEETAIRSTKRVLNIARKTGGKVHVLHITTAEEMEILAKNKDICTVEVLPQHLTFNDSIYEDLGSLAQMNPPIRAERHQKALWNAINSGVVDILGSDHAPHTLEEKAKPYPQSPSGLTGVQTLVPIMLDHVNNGKLTLERFVDITAHGANRVFSLKKKGRIAKGYYGDFTIVDMEQQWTITNDWIASKAGWTPYHNRKVKGKPTHTIIRGNIIMADDQLTKHQMQPIELN